MIRYTCICFAIVGMAAPSVWAGTPSPGIPNFGPARSTPVPTPGPLVTPVAQATALPQTFSPTPTATSAPTPATGRPSESVVMAPPPPAAQAPLRLSGPLMEGRLRRASAQAEVILQPVGATWYSNSPEVGDGAHTTHNLAIGAGWVLNPDVVVQMWFQGASLEGAPGLLAEHVSIGPSLVWFLSENMWVDGGVAWERRKVKSQLINASSTSAHMSLGVGSRWQGPLFFFSPKWVGIDAVVFPGEGTLTRKKQGTAAERSDAEAAFSSWAGGFDITFLNLQAGVAF